MFPNLRALLDEPKPTPRLLLPHQRADPMTVFAAAGHNVATSTRSGKNVWRESEVQVIEKRLRWVCDRSSQTSAFFSPSINPTIYSHWMMAGGSCRIASNNSFTVSNPSAFEPYVRPPVEQQASTSSTLDELSVDIPPLSPGYLSSVLAGYQPYQTKPQGPISGPIGGALLMTVPPGRQIDEIDLVSSDEEIIEIMDNAPSTSYAAAQPGTSFNPSPLPDRVMVRSPMSVITLNESQGIPAPPEPELFPIPADDVEVLKRVQLSQSGPLKHVAKRVSNIDYGLIPGPDGEPTRSSRTWIDLLKEVTHKEISKSVRRSRLRRHRFEAFFSFDLRLLRPCKLHDFLYFAFPEMDSLDIRRGWTFCDPLVVDSASYARFHKIRETEKIEMLKNPLIQETRAQLQVSRLNAIFNRRQEDYIAFAIRKKCVKKKMLFRYHATRILDRYPAPTYGRFFERYFPTADEKLEIYVNVLPKPETVDLVRCNIHE